MKISYLVGSPKIGESFSDTILHLISTELGKQSTKPDEAFYNVNRSLLSEEEMDAILSGDIMVVAWPLYVDGIPGHLLEQLTILESEIKKRGGCKLTVYGVVNCGFIEAVQCRNAARILKLYCERSGLRFGQMLCIGGGEMMQVFLKIGMKFGKGLLATLDKIFAQFVFNISAGKQGENLYMQAIMPGFVFRFVAKLVFWNPHAKANGLSPKDLKRKISLGK